MYIIDNNIEIKFFILHCFFERYKNKILFQTRVENIKNEFLILIIF